MAAKARTVWRCQTCGAGSPRWMGRCGECGEFGTYVEEVDQIASTGLRAARRSVTAVNLSDIGEEHADRLPIGIAELDRVLGGGLVSGSLVLLGGEPGIGKSTLLLQVAERLASGGAPVLYVCGEESPQQIGMRARRLGANSSLVSLLPELDIVVVEAIVRETNPAVLIVDSIQTAYDSELEGSPGSVGQVRACTARLMRIAKDLGVTTLIAGHVTKEGAIAGPRVLEHMVDAVLYFEGDRDHAFRIVRSVKNRFGSSSELGIFEMTEGGLEPVDSPSALLLAERTEAVSGSVAMIAMEGTRPLLVELQALVSPSYLPVPRRLATGIDGARLLQVLAVLERRAGISFAGQDVLVSVSGGIKIAEPALDLPLAFALSSALRDRSLPLDLAAFGEVSLTGRVRPAPRAVARVAEARGLGMNRVVAATRATDAVAGWSGLSPVDTLADALRVVGV